MSQQPLEKIEFQTNVPVEMALAYAEGKLVDSKFPGSKQQYFFSTIDGRCFYLPIPVGEIVNSQLSAQRIQPQERFDLTRHETHNKGRIEVRWRVHRIDPMGEQHDGTFAVPAAPPAENGRLSPPPAPSPLARDLQASIDRAKGNGVNGSHPPTPPPVPHNGNNGNNYIGNGNAAHVVPIAAERPKTKLEDALCTVAAALLAAERYAKAIGYEAWPKQFTSEDVRTFANTMLINGSRENGHNGNGGPR